MSVTRISQLDTLFKHWVYQSVYGGLRNVGPLLLECYPKLSDIIRNWNTADTTLHTMSPISVKHIESRFVCKHHICPSCQGPQEMRVSPSKVIPAPYVCEVMPRVRALNMQFCFWKPVESCLSNDSSIAHTNCLFGRLCRWLEAVTQVNRSDVTILCRGSYTWMPPLRPVCSSPNLLETFS